MNKFFMCSVFVAHVKGSRGTLNNGVACSLFRMRNLFNLPRQKDSLNMYIYKNLKPKRLAGEFEEGRTI